MPSTDRESSDVERAPTMHTGWSPAREVYDLKCSCGWHIAVPLSQVVAQPNALQLAHLTASGHTKEAHRAH